MRMTILSLAYPFAPAGEDAVGGAEQVLASIDRALVEERHASLVLAAEGSHLRGTVLTHPMPARIDDAAFFAAHAHYRRKIAQIVGGLRISLIHAHAIDFASYLPPPGLPLVVTLHMPPSLYPRRAFDVTRPRTTIVCVSSTQRQQVPRSSADIRVIPNGVRLDAFNISPQPIRDRRYALLLGRMCPEKGIHLALEAARRANVDLVVAGDVFPYEAHERYFADSVAPLLDARRRFIGPVRMSDKRALLAGARCLLVPSLVAETSSLVAMEALASGTPVVALRAGALPEIVDHGRTGFVVSEVDEMVKAMGWVDELSPEACRAVAEKRFDGRATVASYMSLYAELTGADTRASSSELSAR
jgi:glycosyltransferase involved in cell wall biosynthesis